MPSWIHNRPAGFGVVHGPWEPALQGNPRGTFSFIFSLPDKCPAVNPAAPLEGTSFVEKNDRFTSLFSDEKYFFIFPDQNRFLPVGNALNGRKNETEGETAWTA